MTDVLHLKHLRVRYRVDRDDPLLRRRLDGVLDRVLGEALEPALARSGVPTEEEICVRSLRVPVRVRLGAGEASAAAAWSAALAEAIAAALADGSRSDVVRFRSRRAALADLALAVAVGRLEHVWAWRQLGLWQGGDAPGERAAAWELATVLVSEPESIVPVLAEVAAAGTLPSLVERIEPTAWADLTRAALTASGGSAAALESVPAPGGDTAAERGRGSHLEDRARRVLERSAVARAAARALPPAGASQRGALAGALAVLAVLEAEPDAARAPDACADVAGAVAEALLRSHEGPDPAPAEDPREPEPRADEPAPAGAHEEPAETGPEPRWTTAHGGLLFLLPVLDDLRVPDEAMRSGALARRPLRWSLHRLALTLVPVDARDPAALAFAGLAPDADPPGDDGEPWGDAELDALAAIRERVEAHLRARLDRPDALPDALSGELVELVCRRSGEIVFDPGWIELRLPLDEVSTEIRRAGLDLDPGWIPWLGAVVRFVYG